MNAPALEDQKRKLKQLLLISWALFFFGLPAGCFGCATNLNNWSAPLFPALAVAANAAVVILWFRSRARLPESERTRGPALAMGFLLIILALLGLSLIALAEGVWN